MSFSSVRKDYSTAFSRKMFFKVSLLILLIVGVFGSAVKLKNSEFFPIRDVKIFGVNHLDHQAVQRVLLSFVNNGFFAVNVERIKEQLLQFAWVEQVMVRRVWPDQVIITINEKTPIALWNKSSMLSSKGDLFSPPSTTYPSNLPNLIGPTGEHLMMSQYYISMSDLLRSLHFKIARLELTPTMAWRLTLDNGIKLNIGHKDVLTRLRHFVKVYPKIVGNRVANVEYIDLRYPNGMAVRWKSTTQPA